MSQQKRTCGECTACCWYPDVHDDRGNIISKAREWCRHCEKGVGCTIYNRRPAVCRDFSCVWLTGFLSEMHRPDRLGIVIDIRHVPDGYKTIFLYFREIHEGALERTDVRNLINSMLKGQFFIVTIALDGLQVPYAPERMSTEDAVVFLEAAFAHWQQLAQEQGISIE